MGENQEVWNFQFNKDKHLNIFEAQARIKPRKIKRKISDT